MSRIGRLPIDVPAGVNITIDGSSVVVKGPRGELTLAVASPIGVKLEDGQVLVTRPDDERASRSLHGLTRALIANMVTGVTQGFEKALEISGVGYRAEKKGNKQVMNLGYSHPVEMEDPEGIETVTDGPVKVIVKGISKEAVGAHAANIRAKRPPEPYKGHGIKYASEHIRRKVGKTG